MLDTDIAPSGGYYKRPFGIETEDEREARRKRIRGYFNTYSELDGSVHANPSALAETAVNLSQSERRSHRFAAASAIAELHLSFPDNTFGLSLHLAEQLLAELCESEKAGTVEHFEARLLRTCLPLFELHQIADNPEAHDELLGTVADELLSFADEIEQTPILKRTDVSSANHMVGRVNEAIIIAGLLDPQLTDKGLVALPALIWQEKGILPQNYAGKNPRFDINVAAAPDGTTVVPIQVKTTRQKGNNEGYASNVRVLYVNDLISSMNARLGQSHVPPRGKLSSLFNGLSDSEKEARLDMLSDELMRKLAA